MEDNTGNGVTVGRRVALGGKDENVVECRDVGLGKNEQHTQKIGVIIGRYERTNSLPML